MLLSTLFHWFLTCFLKITYFYILFLFLKLCKVQRIITFFTKMKWRGYLRLRHRWIHYYNIIIIFSNFFKLRFFYYKRFLFFSWHATCSTTIIDILSIKHYIPNTSVIIFISLILRLHTASLTNKLHVKLLHGFLLQILLIVIIYCICKTHFWSIS